MSTLILELAALAAALLTLAVALLWPLDRCMARRQIEPDVGTDIFDVDEDINAPSVATIELALSRTTDPEGRDWLLDRWTEAKRRAS